MLTILFIFIFALWQTVNPKFPFLWGNLECYYTVSRTNASLLPSRHCNMD